MNTKVNPNSSVNGNGQKSPAFAQKIYHILEGEVFRDIICWISDGNSFVVKDPNNFSIHILPKYFKHGNFSSFIRQLNMYGFRKSRTEQNEIEFTHKLFKRGYKNQLSKIKRKIPENQKESDKTQPQQQNSSASQKCEEYYVLDEINKLKIQQNQIENFCEILKIQNNKLMQQNNTLWKYVLRSKNQTDKDQMLKALPSDISMEQILLENNQKTKHENENMRKKRKFSNHQAEYQFDKNPLLDQNNFCFNEDFTTQLHSMMNDFEVPNNFEFEAKQEVEDEQLNNCPQFGFSNCFIKEDYFAD